MDLVDCSDRIDRVLQTHVPDLVELCAAIRVGLSANFHEVDVSVVPCPDLRPLGFTGLGIGGGLCVAEVGGVGNLFPQIRREKSYDLKRIAAHLGLSDGFIFGSGAGPRPVVGVNCEMVVDAALNEGKIRTHFIRTTDGGYELGTTQDPRFGILANICACRNEAGKPVVRIAARRRTGPQNFTESIRLALAAHFPQKPITLAGIFSLQAGKATYHVMPDFPVGEFPTLAAMRTDWLRYFELRAPIHHASIIHSIDSGLDVQIDHAHGFSAHGQGGHYHDDTTAAEVEYVGYYGVAERILRIDHVDGSGKRMGVAE